MLHAVASYTRTSLSEPHTVYSAHAERRGWYDAATRLPAGMSTLYFSSKAGAVRAHTSCPATAYASTGNFYNTDAIMDSPPQFNEPPRTPSEEEAFAVAAGSRLTPEQQTAKKLQLPLTQRIHIPSGAPTERQLMAQIQAAATWKELEAVVYQKCTPAKAAMPAKQDSRDSSATSTSQSSTSLAGQMQKQQQPQNEAGTAAFRPLPQRQPRRRQAPAPLSVQPQPRNAAAQQQQSSLAGTAPAATASYDTALLHISKPSPLLNHLHVTEAVRRLAQLLPEQPNTLDPTERARAAALIDFLARQCAALAQTLELDPRAIAHVAAGFCKLGHKEEGSWAALQEAAVVQVEGFKAQYVAMLLGSLVTSGARPAPELMTALQHHILQHIHLFKHQSMANTIWALAKLNGRTITASHLPGGTSRITVSAELVSALVVRCGPQLHVWSCQHVAQAAWGLARLGAKPDQAWCKSLLRTTYKLLTKMSPQDLANTIAALPALSAVPNQTWIDAFCTTAAAKMRHTQALGICSMLFGLARVKRAQRQAAVNATKLQKKQEQERHQVIQQQQKADMQTGTACSSAATDAAAAPQGHASSTAAAVHPSVETTSISPAEVKLLRAAVVWLQRLQHQLTPQQLAGVIMSLAELLPKDVLQKLKAAGDVQQAGDVLAKRHELVTMLSTLLDGWQPLMEQQQLGAGLPKKQLRLLAIAWKRLKQE